MMNSSKILLIDDEKRMSESLKTLLVIEGHTVEAFTDSEKAAKLLENESFDLVITDIKMPVVNGLDILEKAHHKDPFLEVILMTGYASLESAKEAVDQGAFSYITKPIEFEELKIAIARSLEKRQTALEKERLLKQLKVANHMLEQKLSEIDALYSASAILAATIDLTETLTQILSLAIDVIGAKIGSVMILDPNKQELYIGAACGLSKQIVAETRLKVGDSISGHVAQSGEPLIIKDIESDVRFSRVNRQHYESKSLISVPLKYKGNILGVVNINNKITGTTFDEHDLKLLNTFGAQAAIAIDRANIFADRDEKINELTVLFEITRKISTIDHIERVGEIIFSQLRKLIHIEAVIWYGLAERINLFRREFMYKSSDCRINPEPPIELKTNKEVIERSKNVDIDYVKDQLMKWFADCLSAKKHAIEVVPIQLHNTVSGIMTIISQNKLSNSESNLAAIVASQTVSVVERQKAILNGIKLVTMGKIISEICHDLKKPLTNLKGNVQVYKSKIKGREASKFFESSENELNRLNDLVMEIVNSANPNMYSTSKAKIKDVIIKASQLLEKDLEKKNIRFTINQDNDVPQIEINNNEIFEAVINIMLNAIESMEDNGVLEVNIMLHPAQEPYVRIAFIDTGCGIPENELYRIFDRYHTTKETGTGLGLAIVERVIKAHNGSLNVESVLGKGTTFKIDLPI
ncbi:MAG: response regulator [candidate division Zixibacteria bacterium]|nr:response regulator [candidate division Zixibacteria bacterium]